MSTKAALATPIRGAILILLLINVHWNFAQDAPGSPDRPWRSGAGQRIAADVLRLRGATLKIDPSRIYTLSELVDFAEAHNPLTRVAWENAAAQAAALGIAQRVVSNLGGRRFLRDQT
jgi:hypothetical protein